LVGGFNHNFKYKGHVYHVQTEDSGVPRAHVTTLLYRGGSIIAREVADYGDIASASDLAAQVEHMMKNQHRLMLKNLKDGTYDARIDQLDAGNADRTELKQTDVMLSVPVREEESAGADEPGVHEKPGWRTGRLDNMVRAYLDAGR
jgi:hypothetical protein